MAKMKKTISWSCRLEGMNPRGAGNILVPSSFEDVGYGKLFISQISAWDLSVGGHKLFF